MYKPPILNRYIHRRANQETNNYLTNKLYNVKSNVDVKCPESFTFYKLSLRKNNTHANSNL